MRGQCLIGISTANCTACAITEGDIVAVDLKLDTESGVVLSRRTWRRRWKMTPKSDWYVAAIEQAKASETRQRRIAKLVNTMRSDRA